MLQTIKYNDYKTQIPQKGKHILAQQKDDQILVYQAFNPRITTYAVANQCFGGAHYSFNRMSWIKPNFLWMMYRCGWADKENQKRVLAIWIDKSDFDRILDEAVFSSYQADLYKSPEMWKADLAAKEVRLQWDPDHDIYGAKQERKAIQLGLKGEILKDFGTKMVREIIDITDFVRTQKQKIDKGDIDELDVPKEWTYFPENDELNRRIKISRQKIKSIT